MLSDGVAGIAQATDLGEGAPLVRGRQRKNLFLPGLRQQYSNEAHKNLPESAEPPAEKRMIHCPPPRGQRGEVALLGRPAELGYLAANPFPLLASGCQGVGGVVETE